MSVNPEPDLPDGSVLWTIKNSSWAPALFSVTRFFSVKTRRSIVHREQRHRSSDSFCRTKATEHAQFCSHSRPPLDWSLYCLGQSLTHTKTLSGLSVSWGESGQWTQRAQTPHNKTLQSSSKEVEFRFYQHWFTVWLSNNDAYYSLSWGWSAVVYLWGKSVVVLSWGRFSLIIVSPGDTDWRVTTDSSLSVCPWWMRVVIGVTTTFITLTSLSLSCQFLSVSQIQLLFKSSCRNDCRKCCCREGIFHEHRTFVHIHQRLTSLKLNEGALSVSVV